MSQVQLQKAQDFLRSVINAYRFMGIPFRQYVIQYLLPAFGFSLVLLGFNIFILSAESSIRPVIYIAAIAIPVLAILYPKVHIGRQRNEIEQKFHLFITHLTVLSLTQTSRVEIFRTIAEEEDYGALAEEIGRMLGLIDTWNMSLDDACRVRAKKAHAQVMANFYEQVAYNVGSGQPLSQFLVNEQNAFIKQYSTRYEANINRVSYYAELFVSVMLVASFGLIFVMLIPFLLGNNPVVLVGSLLFLSFIAQTAFMFIIDTYAPEDYLWYAPDEFDTPALDRAWELFGASIITCIIVAVYTYLIYKGQTSIDPKEIPLYVYPAIPTTPLAIPSIYIHIKETQLERIEDQFPSFIRALGAVESVKQTSTANVLNTLRHKDFGLLTHHIESLFRRLNLNVNNIRSWRHFSAEIGSALIKSFADMYTLGRDLGGDPETLGIIISENFNEVLTLREKRSQVLGGVAGQLRAITVATSVTFFIGLDIIKIMIRMTQDLGLPDMARTFIFPDAYNLTALTTIIFVAVIMNAFLASILVKRADRRHIIGSALSFTVLVWLSFLGGALSNYFFTRVSCF